MTAFREPYLIIGSKGMLGTDLMEALGSAGCDIKGIDQEEVDIGRLESVHEALKAAQPGTVINVAAYTDVDGCESNPALAYNVNAQGPGRLAEACRERKCALIHISTDYVFDGLKRSPYKEDDRMNPAGVYGKSKAEGESLVREFLPDDHAIVRTAWLFGRNGKNFVGTILNLGQTRDVLKVVDDQRGAPTYTRDLASALVKLSKQGSRGTFHITNSGETTWFGFAGKILDKAGIRSVRVEPITTEELGRPAPRPAYSLLDCTKYKSVIGENLRSWEDALDDYLADVPGITA